MRDVDLAGALERLVPQPEADGDWAGVVRDALPARRRRGRLAAGGLAAAAAAAALAVLLWPSAKPPAGILDRALAAIGTGPVLHVVLSEGWGGTLVDLQTGERRRLRAERELWYDPTRGLHEITRLDGTVEDDALIPPGRLAPDRSDWVRNFGTGYRRALESGTARVSGTDVVDGVPVYWIKIHRELLPDVADGKLHEFAQQVAVSQATYEPVATRDTRDGETGPDGLTLVRRIETAAAGAGDFHRLTRNLDGVPMRLGIGSELSAAEAEAVLGRPALWAGREVAGLPFQKATRIDYAVGGVSGRAVRLDYGGGARRVELTESATSSVALRRGALRYVPPDGSILLFGPSIGFLHAGGLYVSFESSDEDATLAVARSLVPLTP